MFSTISIIVLIVIFLIILHYVYKSYFDKETNINYKYNYMNKVLLKKSNILNAGNGLFANIHFNKGELITKYDGTIFDKKDYVENSDYSLYIDDKVILGDKLYKTSEKAAQFINDIGIIKNEEDIESYIKTIYETNSYLVYTGDEFIAISIKKIKPGEELYVHYGITYWLIKNKIKIDSDKLSFYQEQEKDLLDRYLTSLDMYM